MHPLLDQVARGEETVAALRAALTAAGGPLRRTLPDGRVEVTFVWLAPSVALQCGLAHHGGRSVPLTAVADGVWAHHVVTTDDALVSYRFVVDDPFLRTTPEDDAGWQALMLEAQASSFADPHNPATIPPLALLFGLPVAAEQYESVLALAGAPDGRWFGLHDAPHGATERWPHTSDALGSTRDITVLVPPGASTAAPLPLVVLLDGSSWLAIAGVPRALDAAVAAGALPPSVVAFVHEAHGSLGLADRTAELSCNAAHAAMLATELLPELRRRYPVAAAAGATVLGGASLGGLQSAYTAMEHPHAVGNVLSVSGSFWYGQERDGQPEWLARRLAAEPRRAFRLYQQIGRLEDGPLALSPGVSHLVANRHFHDVAVARGHEVTYEETTTAHDIAAFRVALLRGLAALLPEASA